MAKRQNIAINLANVVILVNLVFLAGSCQNRQTPKRQWSRYHDGDFGKLGDCGKYRSFVRLWKGTEAYYGGDFGKFADSVKYGSFGKLLSKSSNSEKTLKLVMVAILTNLPKMVIVEISLDL